MAATKSDAMRRMREQFLRPLPAHRAPVATPIGRKHGRIEIEIGAGRITMPATEKTIAATLQAIVRGSFNVR